MKKKYKKTALCTISFIPVIIMLFLIFGFSNQNGESSSSLSMRISLLFVNAANDIFHLNADQAAILAYADSIHFFVRKLAHITEFFILTFCWYLPLFTIYKTSEHSDLPNGISNINIDYSFNTSLITRTVSSYKFRILAAFLLGVLCASLDEFHQTFIPMRCGTPVDVCIDSIGITAASLILLIINHIKHSKTKTRTV